MLSSREVRNFRAFVLANPHLIDRRSPQGAYDAMPPDLDLSRGLPSGAFQGGDVFDMEDVEASAPQPQKDFWARLKLLADKLSREDWADIHDILTGGQRPVGDDIPDLRELPKNAIERERKLAADCSIDTLAEAARLGPGFERIKIDGAGMGTRYHGSSYHAGNVAEAAAIAPDFARIKCGA
jgi:hypothetical protein